jgi:hypothetical protein
MRNVGDEDIPILIVAWRPNILIYTFEPFFDRLFRLSQCRRDLARVELLRSMSQFWFLTLLDENKSMLRLYGKL